MKKLLIVLLIVLGLSSCTEDKSKTYTLKYVVFYPNYNDTVEVVSNDPINDQSTKGTNSIWTGCCKYYYNNTAPYKILSYTVKENK